MTPDAIRCKEWRAANPDKVIAARIAGREKHMAWRSANKHRLREISVAYRERRNAIRRESPDKDREYARRRRATNPEIHRARKAKRRAQQKNAFPFWLSGEDREDIAGWYRLGAHLGMHVDHVVPLVHPLVCGLHVPWNLQLLTPSENHQKRNKFENS